MEENQKLSDAQKSQRLSVGVGTEEGGQKLEPKSVKCVSIDMTQKTWNNVLTDTLLVMVKHPDKQEPFPMYNVAYQKGSSIKYVGWTIYYDSTGKLLKGTAPAEICRLFNLPNLSAMVGKEFPTITSPKGFLAIKAY